MKLLYYKISKNSISLFMTFRMNGHTGFKRSVLRSSTSILSGFTHSETFPGRFHRLYIATRLDESEDCHRVLLSPKYGRKSPRKTHVGILMDSKEAYNAHS